MSATPHASTYANMTAAQWQWLSQNDTYRQAVAKECELKDVKTTIKPHFEKDELCMGWTVGVHKQSSLPRIVRAMRPGGIHVRWEEQHRCNLESGTVRLSISEPMKANLLGTISLHQNDDGSLTKTVAFDVKNVELPELFRFFPNADKYVIHCMNQGMDNTDKCVRVWLQQHQLPTQQELQQWRASLDEDGGSDTTHGV